MIKDWIKFNESNSNITYDTLSEIIMFRNYTRISDFGDIHKKIENFVSMDLHANIDTLTPITTE